RGTDERIRSVLDGILEGDGAQRGRVHDEAQDLRPRVVTDGVELMTDGARLLGIDLGGDDAFLADQRSGEDVPVRTDDHAVAAGQPVVGAAVEVFAPRNVGRYIGAAHAEVHTDDVHPPFF